METIMTKHDIKTKIVVAALLLVISISTIPMQSVLAQEIATITQKTTSVPVLTDEYLLSVTPTKLAEADLAEYRSIATNNVDVQSAIDGKPYRFTTQGYLGNIYKPDSPWYPEIHLTVETDSEMLKDVAIVIDPQTKSVKEIQVVEFHLDDQNGQNNTYSTQRFTGHSGTPDGIKVDMKAPTFVWDGVSRTKGNVLLLNGLMQGSSWSQACTSSSVPSTYWAQIGFYWKNSGKINWSDTAGNCSPQFPSFSYVAGKTYEFRIVGATTGWAYYAIRTDTGSTWTIRGPAVNSAQIATATNTDQTSVFFENKYLASEPTWYGQFSNAPQSSDAQYKTTLFGPYTNWSNTKLVDKDCNNITNVYPYNSSKEVMTGDLKSGGSTTWDVNRMETYYPRC